MANRLFVDKTPEVWIVSRVKITVTAAGVITLDSFDATPAQLIDKLTGKTRATILPDILPTTTLSMHLEAAAPREAVELIMKPFPDYSVKSDGGYIQISKVPSAPFPAAAAGAGGVINIRESGGLFEVEVERARLGDVLDRLFSAANREYLSFVRPDQILERARFSGKDLYNTAAIILEQGGGECR